MVWLVVLTELLALLVHQGGEVAVDLVDLGHRVLDLSHGLVPLLDLNRVGCR